MSTAMATSYENLILEIQDRVGRVTINRPKVLNALNEKTVQEIHAVFSSLRENADVGVVILTGAGEKAFVAGADINELAVMTPLQGEASSKLGQLALREIELLGKPVIAAINGFALGGGCELALACHIRFASESAKLGLPEVGLGIIPGYGGTQRLPRLVGTGRALELILSGRRVKAGEAEKIGLVNRVVPLAALREEAEKLAQAILKNGPLAVAASLEAVHRGTQLPLDQGLRFESSLFGVLAASEDMHEGLRAFLEKRPARFQRT